MNLDELNDKLKEVESQIETLSLQRDAIYDAMNIEIANDSIGDILYNVYKVPNGDGSIYRIHTGVKDICQTTDGKGIIYNVLEIRLDIGTTVHMTTKECVYVSSEEFHGYNEFANKDELKGIRKLYEVIKGVILMNNLYGLV